MRKLACAVCLGVQHEFVLPATPVRWMTMADLTKRDGEYTVVAKVNGKPFKSYKAEVKVGQLQRHARTRMDMEPHTAFISPRQVDTSSRTTSRCDARRLLAQEELKMVGE